MNILSKVYKERTGIDAQFVIADAADGARRIK